MKKVINDTDGFGLYSVGSKVDIHKFENFSGTLSASIFTDQDDLAPCSHLHALARLAVFEALRNWEKTNGTLFHHTW